MCKFNETHEQWHSRNFRWIQCQETYHKDQKKKSLLEIENIIVIPQIFTHIQPLFRNSILDSFLKWDIHQTFFFLPFFSRFLPFWFWRPVVNWKMSCYLRKEVDSESKKKRSAKKHRRRESLLENITGMRYWMQNCSNCGISCPTSPLPISGYHGARVKSQN